MGNDTGFLEYERKEPGYRAVLERVKDFRAVELEPDEEEIYQQAARCMDCGIPFCHGSGCPLKNMIPEFNEHVYNGDWQAALEILLSTCSFPEFTGRICPAPCEAACVDAINGEAVTIRQIELAIIEMGFERGLINPILPKERSYQKVAVVGSGPAGLVVASELNRAGYRVTVFDEAEKAGGLLRYGIPDFKLEKTVVDRRIRLMEEEGVVFEQNVVVGKDISTRYLTYQFDAICLACGARQPRDLDVPGRDLSGIHFAMEFLTQQNQRLAGEPVDPQKEILATGKSVVVIGGGDTGSDCIGTSLRQGARQVVQLEILPKPPTARSKETPWPMWPLMLRESHAHQEGGQRRFAVTTQAFKGSGGRVSKLLCKEVRWFNEDGRQSFETVDGSEFELEADLVLLAMGFTGPGNDTLIRDFGLVIDGRGNVVTDDAMMTSVPGVFAAGDMEIGQSLVVRAMASGKKAARGILGYLKREHDGRP